MQGHTMWSRWERGGQLQFCLSEGPADEVPPSMKLGVFEPGLGGSWVPGLEFRLYSE